MRFSHDKEKAAQWKNWMESPCWRELLEMMDEIKREATTDEDNVATKDLTVQLIAECRGVRKGLDRLKMRVLDIV